MLFIVLIHGLVGATMSGLLMFQSDKFFEISTQIAGMLSSLGAKAPVPCNDPSWHFAVAAALFVYGFGHILQGLMSSSRGVQVQFVITELVGASLFAYAAFVEGYMELLGNAVLMGTFCLLGFLTLPSGASRKSKKQ